MAFKFSARALDPTTLEVRYRIADGYYMYRDKFKFARRAGRREARRGAVSARATSTTTSSSARSRPIARRCASACRSRADGHAETRLKLTVTSQGCADVGVCYVPQVQTATSGSRASRRGAYRGAAAPPARAVRRPRSARRAGASSDEARFERLLASGSLWLIAAAFFGAGILLTFTPCVLPMIPILSGIIVGEGRRSPRARALTLSLAYVLGMSVTYTGIGVGAALSGNLLSAALQNPWVLVRLRRGVRAAVAVDVRLLRTAAALRLSHAQSPRRATASRADTWARWR